tara:strand:+ start:70 stop:570 length:501 start_codon:yes stop_codon:yes gene_type:complete
MNKNIRRLTFDDEEKINDLILISLRNEDQFFLSELLPTEKNAEAIFVTEIFPIISDGDPAIGFFENDNLLGMTFCSTKLNRFYDFKKPCAIGLMTICHPKFRNQGIGSELRLELGRELYKMGIKRFIFEIKCENEASLNNARKIAKKLNKNANIKYFRFEGPVDDI